MVFPATACFIQTKIGAKKAACLDISAACAGFLFAIEIAQQFITCHTYDTVLVIGAEKLTTITDWTERNTCVLFGDGAGAAILARPPNACCPARRRRPRCDDGRRSHRGDSCAGPSRRPCALARCWRSYRGA